jgi:uncharacterized protein YgiM (DUF1202 family)
MKVDLPLFSKPDAASAHSATAQAGESARVVKSDGHTWSQLRTQSGELGWYRMQGQYIQIGAKSYTTSDVFEFEFALGG